MYARPNRLIITQYEPPAHISLLAAAELLGDGKRAIAAQIVDLAVRKVVTIGRPTGKGKRSGFTITLAGDPAAEGPDEEAVLIELFDGRPYVGATRTVAPGRNRELGQQMQGPHRFATARLVTAGLARERGSLASLFAPSRDRTVVPTERAYPIVDHLWGVRDYIAWAEKDRLAFHQAPDTAERRELGELEILRLHERLLPYAVLFGLEKDWMRELDVRVRSLPPELVGDLGLVVDAVHVGVIAVDLIVDVADLADILSASDALEGVGSFFGGVAEFLGDLG